MADFFIHYGYIFIRKFVNAGYKNTNHKEQQRYPKKKHLEKEIVNLHQLVL
jgi:hypothetical protein